MNKQILKSTLIAAAGLLFANSAMADTATTTFQVTATVADSCLVSATPLAFGVYDPAAVKDGASEITTTCTKGTKYNIGLDAGSNASNATTPSTRAMTVNSEYLSYDLYSNIDRNTVWGNTIGTDTVEISASVGGEEVHYVYGRIPAGQYVTAGDYVDTINVTITF